ncbi:MAG: Glucose 1-dehydrogenase 1 [Pseudomonadales bacterium]|nr:Glucose 1-dehydrogenase 1 [Pseudomonadales bacterium]
MSARLHGKVAFVTGIGTAGPGWGTGKAIAATFAREGARVFGMNRGRESAAETLALIERDGGRGELFVGDVTSGVDVERAVQACLATFGRIDILVNNVGCGGYGGVVEQSEEDWDRVFATNLKSAYHTCRQCLPVMLANGGGTIVNISSLVALRWTGHPLAAYASSKAALHQLTRQIAMQYARQNIRANTVVPGMLETPMVVEPIRRQYGDTYEQVLEQRHRLCPGGRMGDAHDVAWAALYLASDEAKFVNGIELLVDGGMSCQVGA